MKYLVISLGVALIADNRKHFKTLLELSKMQLNARKTILASALAMAGAIAPTAVFAQAAEFTWYGRLDLALESNSNGAVSRMAVQNFSSRLGIRGEHKLAADLSGIFQVETGIAPDDTAQSKTLASRNSFVGLKSAAAGTIIMGTHDMPLKSLEGTAYALWGEGDLEELIIHGKASRAAIGSTVFDNAHTRKTNVLLYTSPKFANIVAKVAYSPDEAKVAAAGAVPSYSKSMYGASVEYNDGMFNGGFATQAQENFNAPTATVNGATMKANKITGGISIDALTVGIAMSKLDNSLGKKTSNWLATTTYALGATTLKASFGKSSESSSGAADELSAAALEADYAFDKSFTLYTYYTRITNGAKAKGSFAAADNFPAVVNAGDDPHALGLGIRYNF
jgi:predicted porin